jgi:hypothetical protein
MNFRVHNSPPHVHILTYINPVHALPRYSPDIKGVVSVWLPITFKALLAVKKKKLIQNQSITSVLCKSMLNYAILKLLHDAAKYVTLVTDDGMILTGENRRTFGETCPSATWTTQNPTWTDLSSNSEATNRLSHGKDYTVRPTAWLGTCHSLSAATFMNGRFQTIWRWCHTIHGKKNDSRDARHESFERPFS